MKSKPLRHKSYSLYLCALSVFDTLTLIKTLVYAVDTYILDLTDSPSLFHNFTNTTCKLYEFTTNIISLMSSWLIVLMAIERVLAVCFPFKKVIIRKQSGAALAILILFVCVSFSQSFRIVMIEHISYNRGENETVYACASGEPYRKIYTDLYVYFNSWTLIFLLPVIIIVASNTLVLYQIISVRKEVIRQESDTRFNRALRRKHRSTYMLLVVSFFYILTLLPLYILQMITQISINHASLDFARDVYYTLKPYVWLCESIALLNYSMNFFIYVLSGKSFRLELRKIFRKQKSQKRNVTARSTREEFFRFGMTT